MGIKYWLAATAFYTAATTFAVANPVVNGNFQTDDLTGWTVTLNDLNIPADIGVYNGYDYQPCCSASGAPADLANYFASFGPGNLDNSGYLEQTLSLPAGSYVLTYQIGAFGSIGLTQALTASIGGASQTEWASADNGTDTQWTTYNLDFTSSGSPLLLAFNAASGGVGDNIDVNSDNVSVSSTVPEASTWAMSLIGFAGLGYTGCRRGREHRSAPIT